MKERTKHSVVVIVVALVVGDHSGHGHGHGHGEPSTTTTTLHCSDWVRVSVVERCLFLVPSALSLCFLYLLFLGNP